MGCLGDMPQALFIHTVLGAFLIGAGANAWNQYLEREYDAKMKRTQDRPLVTGELSLSVAMAFALITSVGGLVYLYIFVNTLAFLTGLVLWGSYVLVYRPLKRITPYCVYAGGVSGALPPFLGWVAARNEISLGAWILFAILYAWQVPHFLAIAWVYRTDYLAAGFKMPAADDNAQARLKLPMLGYTALLFIASLLPAYAGMTGPIYLGFATVLGVAFFVVVVRFLKGPHEKTAIHVILASVIYLCILITAMTLNKL